MKIRLLLMTLTAMLLFSCSTNKENTLAYFKDLGESGTLPMDAAASYPIRIQPDDELIISVTSAIPEATAAYNLPMDNPAVRSTYTLSQQPRTQTYIVDEQGYIMLPVLGRLHVGGMTTDEISSKVRSMVSANVRDPYVRVEIVNFTVDVMGEVRSPQRLTATREYFTVLDALSQCGDLTEYGKRDRVYVIRTEGNQRTYHRLNLMDSQVFSSPYFHLQQNDVVYVEPNEIRIDNSKYNSYNSFKLSLTSTIVSAVSVIASLIIALTR